MRTLSPTWLVADVLLAAAGCCLAPVSSPSALVPLSVCAAVVGFAVPRLAMPARAHIPVPAGIRARGARTGRALVSAGLATVAANASYGLALVLGALPAFVVAFATLLLLCEHTRRPAVVGRLATTSARHVKRAVLGLAGCRWRISCLTDCCDLRQFGVDDLCHAWRVSFRTLQKQPSVERQVLVVRHRQALLDEFERRNSAGLEAWLASQPAPADALQPYLHEGRDEAASRIDWSQLIPKDDG